MGSSQSTSQHPSGYKVLSVVRESPAHLAGIEIFFDIIIEINGITFNESQGISFSEIIKKYEGVSVKVVIFNTLNRTFRDTWIIPARWSTEIDSIFGVRVKFIKDALEFPKSIRVLTVHENSVAAAAGLQPLNDYLLGTPEMDFSSVNDIAYIIGRHIRSLDKNPLLLYVYNSIREEVRLTQIQLDSINSTLGCDIGEGYLHQIPPPKMSIHRNAYFRYMFHPPVEGNDNNEEIYIETKPVSKLPLSPIKSQKTLLYPDLSPKDINLNENTITSNPKPTNIEIIPNSTNKSQVLYSLDKNLELETT